MTSLWSVRPFRAGDADELASLHERSMGPLGQRGWNSAEIATLANAPGNFGFVADSGDSPEWLPLGFVLARTVADEAEILTLAVAPTARRRGIGSALLDRAGAEAAARDAVRLLLEVSVDNAAALALYEGSGFAAVGSRARYYRRVDGGNVDALVLARALPVQRRNEAG